MHAVLQCIMSGFFVADVFWQLFGTYLMMQLFTAVIIENFDDVAKDDSSFMPVDRLNEFVRAVRSDFGGGSKMLVPFCNHIRNKMSPRAG